MSTDDLLIKDDHLIKRKSNFLMRHVHDFLEKNKFIPLKIKPDDNGPNSFAGFNWSSEYKYNNIQSGVQATRKQTKINITIKNRNSGRQFQTTLDVEEHIEKDNEVLRVHDESKLNVDLQMLINGYEKLINNTSSGGNGNQSSSMYFGGPRDSSHLHMMPQESLPPLQPGQFVNDFYGAEPTSSHNHLHMGNLVGPETSSLARDMMFMHGSSTQLMPRTYSSHTHHINNPKNSNSTSIVICGSCHKNVQENEETVFCGSGCKIFYHRTCVGLTEQAFKMLNQEKCAEWVCDKCVATKHVPPVKLNMSSNPENINPEK